METTPTRKKKPAIKLEPIIMTEKNSTQPTNNSTPIQAEPITTTINNESNIVQPITKQLKKRGRKRKIPINEKYNDPTYCVMWPEICMAKKVLVDRYDNVYTYDLESPIWLGVKTVYGKIDNTTYKTPLTKYNFQP